jgi:hypothetical protein
MITITDSDTIATLFRDFKSGSQGAYATCRALTGQYEQANCEEWAEHGTHNGQPCKVYYFFDRTTDGIDGDAETYPWDDEHITKIEFAEKDEDGDYETL